MNEELVQEILHRLDSAGEIAGQGFEILIRQVYISAIGNVIWIIWFAAVLFGIVKILKKLGYLGGEREWLVSGFAVDTDRSTVVGALGTVALTLVLFTGVNLYQIAAKLINPEFYAIRWILKSAS